MKALPLVHFQAMTPGHTPDLFDDPDEGGRCLRGFEQAFEAWAQQVLAQGRLQREPSIDAYRVMWTGLARWCLGRQPPLPLDQLRSDDLALFIASRSGVAGADSDLSPRYVWRLLHLVDRVLVQRAHDAGTAANRCAHTLLLARPEWRYANAAQRDELPDHLSAAQARLLVNHLSQARPRAGLRGADVSWQDLRNHAAVALQLGAGLSPGEVRALQLPHVVVDGGRVQGLPWKLQVPGDGTGAAREAPLARWAAQLLRQWLEVRSRCGIAGDRLFPSARSGKPWGKVAHYGAVTRVLEASGIDKHLVPGGSFRLRHTFALRQLRRGKTPDEVARWLGVVDPAVMARYRRTVYAPVDDLA